MISKRECKKRIEKLVSKKKYSNIDFYLFEIYINIYLLLLKERKLAQISIYKRGDLFTIIPKIKKLLDKIYPYYMYEKDNNSLVLYHKKYEINKMNRTYGKKYAKNLGSFYVCAGDLGKLYKRYTYLLRPLIRISYQNQLNHKIEFGLYAQMCPRTVLIKNLLFFYNIKKRLNRILNKIHPNIHAYFTIETYNSSK